MTYILILIGMFFVGVVASPLVKKLVTWLLGYGNDKIDRL